MVERGCYSVPNPYFLSDRFVYAHHTELGTVYIKLNCADDIEEIGIDIVKRMHNTPLDKIKELRGWREANEIEGDIFDHIGEEYWQRIYRNSQQVGETASHFAEWGARHSINWGDVQLLDTFILELSREEKDGADWGDSEKFYTEVLRRFHEFNDKKIP